MSAPKILVVDDEQIALRNLHHILTKEGYEVTVAQSGQQALNRLAGEEFDLVLTDLKMPKVDGMEILHYSREHQPDAEVIMITGYATIDSAIEATKAGAYHYVAKPYKLDEVRKVVSEALTKRRLTLENRHLKKRLAEVQGVNIITDAPEMRRLLDDARQVAQSDCSILITGESGTGKELLARYIHEQSPRAERPMVSVNCGVFTEELLASELFGHEKGAYTSADRKKVGLVEAAAGGTLFLDEITEMSPAMQVKLLRVIQEKEVMAVGATKPVAVDVRFVAATNREIVKMIREGQFRQDLYFRINVVNLHLPPLADRRRDISLLAHFFIHKFSTRMNKTIQGIAPEAMEQLQAYDYPGNIRELENIIERAIVLTRGETIEVAHLPDLDVHTVRTKKGTMPSLEEQERSYIEWVLEQTGGNKTKAAEILGIDRVSLWRKLKKTGPE